ncbi:nucleotide sugar dehydrogenase [Bacillus sp. FJAT-49736]|uniref:nucleotide sugar dehydrogenase n=1 Tax=Bacillus sp. FJAT-49736 TaxID=2833582 RepID=UPI001BC93322|nr:nucleotide sugar dehydrogenase [Bacillus sp. FJAT-49736]MBS4172209.1 nucleotide sugar dehydrogenase [Bacillus sp. FJAT-49736]
MNNKIAVIGQGFVGLPLSIMLVEKGFHVIGIDLDREKIASLNNSKSYIGDIDDNRLKKANRSHRYKATSDFDVMTGVDTIIICVPTPLTEQHEPDLRYVISAGEEIQKRLQKGQLVILESSTFPGTTKEVLLPILEKSGLKVGADFFLANSPERIDPGNDKYEIDDIPKVVGGITDYCKNKVISLYQNIYHTVVPVSSTEAAELTKLLENTFRFINISFINEMAILSDHLNTNIWEVIEAAATKPYGFTPYYPGPGIGGHCIPVDPLYLQWKLEQIKTSSEFITLSDSTNRKMIDYIVTRTEELLKTYSPTKSPNILVYGITYKKDVADTRDSPSLLIIEKLRIKGANVQYHDPFVPSIKIGEEVYTSKPLTANNLKDSDIVLILTDHTSIPLNKIIENASLIFDTRNVTNQYRNNKIIRLGDGGKIS